MTDSVTHLPFDAGLQPERTELSWRRTLLAIALGALVSLRLLPGVFGSLAWVIPGVLALGAVVMMWHAARHRYRLVNEVTAVRGDRAPLPDGRLLALLALVVTGGAMFGLACIVVLLVQRSQTG